MRIRVCRVHVVENARAYIVLCFIFSSVIACDASLRFSGWGILIGVQLEKETWFPRDGIWPLAQLSWSRAPLRLLLQLLWPPRYVTCFFSYAVDAVFHAYFHVAAILRLFLFWSGSTGCNQYSGYVLQFSGNKQEKVAVERVKAWSSNEGWSGLDIVENWWRFVHWLPWPCLRNFLVHAISHDLWQFNYNCELLPFWLLWIICSWVLVCNCREIVYYCERIFLRYMWGKLLRYTLVLWTFVHVSKLLVIVNEERIDWQRNYTLTVDTVTCRGELVDPRVFRGFSSPKIGQACWRKLREDS